MNRKIALLAFIMSLIITNVKSQTLNPTYVLDTPGAADNFKGGYTFSYSKAGTPWNGALISFGGAGNNYDCQISTDYGLNRFLFELKMETIMCGMPGMKYQPH
ncbi:hypothetical protein [Flavobacterium sp. 22076]|uniref:hypothetical protein n=1 Tax=unclassified Flavobacterium TaxID=196869 RepID=UPI003F828204